MLLLLLLLSFIALGTQFPIAKKIMQIVQTLRLCRLVEKLGRQAPERVAEAY